MAKRIMAADDSASVRQMVNFTLMLGIMLTTESQDSRKLEGKTAGATGWIAKPFKPEQMIAVVNKVLG